MKNYKQYKELNNRRFDLGTIKSSGRLTTALVDDSQFSSTAGYSGYTSDAENIRTSILPNTLNTVNTTLTTTAAPVLAHMALAGASLTSWGAGGAGSAGALAGYGAGALNAAMGTIGLINGFGSFKNNISGQEMVNASGRTTLSKYGVAYDTYNGVDANGVLAVTDAENSASKNAVTMSGMLTGAGIGGGVGTIFGPVGTLVGSVIGGGLGALFGGIFGGESAEEKRQRVQNLASATQDTMTGYNTQSEAVAGSKGLRTMFNSSHADQGKSVGQMFESGKNGQIWTPGGKLIGQVKGLASHDEGMINLATGETNYMGSADPTIKEQRKDNVPVGGVDFDENVAIPGHMKDVDGVMFADKARPYFKANELIKIMDSEIDKKLEENESNKKRDKNTMRFINKKLNSYKDQAAQQYTANTQAIADIVDRQSAMQHANEFDKGKTPKFDKGWSDIFGTRHGLISPITGLANGIVYSIADSRAANSETLYALNSYIPNSTAAAALKVLGGLGYDPSAELAELNNTAGRNRYAINQAGNLSAGQKIMLSTAANNDLFSKRGAILRDAYNKNALYKSAYANALMNAGQDAAQRQQQALATQQAAYAQAVGAKQKLQAQARKNWYTTIQQSLKDWNTNAMFNRTADLYNSPNNGGNDTRGYGFANKPNIVYKDGGAEWVHKDPITIKSALLDSAPKINFTPDYKFLLLQNYSLNPSLYNSMMPAVRMYNCGKNIKH